GHAHLRHLGETGALAPEQLAAAAGRLVEIEDVPPAPHECGIVSQTPCILAVMPILAWGGYPPHTQPHHLPRPAAGPRVLYVPTRGNEDRLSTVSWYERLRGRAAMTHLHFFPYPPDSLRDLTLSHDIVLVTGGNTANALAIWRVHGFDGVLREAWEQGLLL